MLTLLLAAVLATNSFNRIENPARITADSTYYDRREGLVIFKGNVHVNDPEYALHADRAFVFVTQTNSLDRIAAMGSVAMTNGTKRASGVKVVYRRDNGLVVLYGDAKTPALVADSVDGAERVVRGKKIRFWIDREQVEVLEADISTSRESISAVGDIPGLSL